MKYIVSVTRIGYGGIDLEVDADSEDKAKEIALDQAGGESFSEHHSDYQVDQVVKRTSEVADRKLCVTSARRRELVVKLLDDDYGINEDAYNTMMEAGMIPDDIAMRVKATEDRFYLTSESRNQLERDFHE